MHGKAEIWDRAWLILAIYPWFKPEKNKDNNRDQIKLFKT